MRARLFILGVLLFQTAFAQPGKEPQSAARLYQAYLKSQDEKDLEKAKIKSDADAVQPETKNSAKTWLTRGNIYYALYSDALAGNVMESGEFSQADKRNEAYIKTPDSLLNVACESYLKARQLDTAFFYSAEIKKGIAQSSYYSIESGTANFRNGSPVQAMNCFFRAFVLGTNLAKVDTVLLYNVALSGLKAKVYDSTLIMGALLSSYGYEPEATYILTECYVRSGDTAQARTLIDSAVQKYLRDEQIKSAYLDVLLASRNFVSADECVRIWTQQQDSVAETFLLIGNAYERMANPIGRDSSALPKPWNYEILLAQAEANYRKALVAQPDDVRAHCNLGLLYFNQGFYCYNQWADHADDGQTSDRGWVHLFQRAAVELEAARKLDPENLDILRKLKSCYGQLGETVKYQEVKERIEEVEK